MDRNTFWLRNNRVVASLRRGFAALVVGLSLYGQANADELQPLTVRDFSPGLATENDASIICDGCAQDLLNVDVENGSIEKRRGSVKVNSTTVGSFTAQPVKLFHWFEDENEISWIITKSSNSLLKSSDGGVSSSILTSTHGVTSDSRFCAVNAFGKARLTDGTTNWILWDGTTVGTSTSSPKGLTCEFFAERIWTSVGSFLEASANGDPEDWLQDEGTDSDAFFTYVRQNDGYDIKALKRFKNGLLVFKNYSTDYLVMNQDGVTFTLLPISSRVGTQQPYSVVERENDVIWMGHDGYYSYDGSVLRRISDAIDPTFNQILQLSVGENTYTETGQVQFAAGTNTQTSATQLSGSVVLATATRTDSTGTEWAAGTQVNTSTQVVSGQLTFPVFYNVSFEGGSGLSAFGFDGGNSITGVTNVARSSTTAARTGTWYGPIGSITDSLPPIAPSTSFSYDVSVLTSTDGVLATTGYTTPTVGSGWVQTSINLAAYSGQLIKIKFTGGLPPNAYFVNEDPFLCNGGTLSWYHGTFYYTVSVASDTTIGALDDFAGSVVVATASYTSAALNTTFAANIWQTSAVNYSANGHSVTFQTQASSNGSAWDSAVSWTPGTPPTSSGKTYLRYIVNFATGAAADGVDLPYVDDATITGRASSGRYLSSPAGTGDGVTWNPFTGLSTANGGTVTFELYRDTDTVMNPLVASTFISSQTIVNGATPSIGFGTYTRIGTTFTVTADGQIPSMEEFTLSWNEGGGGNFPVWSTYYQGSYISAVAISSATGNDRMLVYDRNGSWTMYSYPAYCLGIYRQKPYFGSNLQGDLVRFQADGIFNDYDGSAINSYWVSKEFDFGFPLTEKTINRYYLTAEYALNSDALFEWGVNRGSLTSESPLGTLDLDLNTGFFRKSINPSSLSFKKGLSHRFKFSDSDTDDFFKIFSFTIKADLETSP